MAHNCTGDTVLRLPPAERARGTDPVRERWSRPGSRGEPMFRETLTLLAAAALTISGGAIVLTLGLILPWRWCFNPTFRVWSAGILRTAGVRLDIVHLDAAASGRDSFFVGNHQSALDIPIMAVATRGRVRFLAKRSLFRIPLFGLILRCFGFVSIDRSSARSAKSAIDRMLARLAERGGSMLVFPEGTRTDDGSIGTFKRGSVHVCQAAVMPIVPFAIDGSLAIHRRRVYRVQPGVVRVVFGHAIEAEEARGMSTDDLTRRLRDEVGRLKERAMNPVDAGGSSATVAPMGGAG